ncbi:hydroxyphenylacetyl-CoA thioesterase PaaI [Arthrobacter sp. D2-10]
MRDTDVRPVHPMLDKDYASQWLGVEVLHLGDGHATATMRVREEMLNGFGIAHGGMIFAFADTVFALACNPVSETETITVASGVDINFLSSALPGEILTAVATRTSATGRSGIYDITITAGQDGGAPDAERTVALFRGRSRTVPNRRNRNLTPTGSLPDSSESRNA